VVVEVLLVLVLLVPVQMEAMAVLLRLTQLQEHLLIMLVAVGAE
jgi:hypothetical protein